MQSNARNYSRQFAKKKIAKLVGLFPSTNKKETPNNVGVGASTSDFPEPRKCKGSNDVLKGGGAEPVGGAETKITNRFVKEGAGAKTRTHREENFVPRGKCEKGGR